MAWSMPRPPCRASSSVPPPVAPGPGSGALRAPALRSSGEHAVSHAGQDLRLALQGRVVGRPLPQLHVHRLARLVFPGGLVAVDPAVRRHVPDDAQPALRSYHRPRVQGRRWLDRRRQGDLLQLAPCDGAGPGATGVGAGATGAGAGPAGAMPSSPPAWGAIPGGSGVPAVPAVPAGGTLATSAGALETGASDTGATEASEAGASGPGVPGEVASKGPDAGLASGAPGGGAEPGPARPSTRLIVPLGSALVRGAAPDGVGGGGGTV